MKIEVGPLTPQETDSICQDLKKYQIPFEILKDDESEKEATRADFQNIVERVEFRTQTYLGQIYYLQIEKADYEKLQKIFEKMGFSGETSNSTEPEELQNSEPITNKRVWQKHAKRVGAAVFAMFIGATIAAMTWNELTDFIKRLH